ncbi:MAG TPA: RsmE family RNA methyltransferase [Chloroflexota bacterium]|jgi:16S rRNA (uracil1498-N3)-methyltransferase|nr:RsmE family RNA methyltransferase [Chloroflexota bacterium]
MGDAGDAIERAGLHRFFVEPSALDEARVIFTTAQQQQLRRVLRLRAGDRVVVCPGDGTEAIVTLHLEGPLVWGEPRGRAAGRAEPARDVWLYQSALRGERFTWLLQKGTEIGVRGFVPVLFQHTQTANYAARADHYRAVIREAAEQCERTRLPDLLPAQPFAAALAQSAAHADATRLLLDERESTNSLRAAVTQAGAPICLFVGPEGGLHEEERALAHAAGMQPVSLGRRILRSETAGLIGAALALAASGDLG